MKAGHTQEQCESKRLLLLLFWLRHLPPCSLHQWSLESEPVDCVGEPTIFEVLVFDPISKQTTGNLR